MTVRKPGNPAKRAKARKKTKRHAKPSKGAKKSKKVETPDITLNVTPAAGKPGKFLGIILNGVGELFRDTIDLNSATSRNRFIAGALKAVFKGVPAADWPAEVREALNAQLIAAAAVPPGAPEPSGVRATDKAAEDPRIAELAKMPDDVRAEAEALLCNPKLLERVSADIEALGIVGERLNRMILYLVGTSAQLARPLAVITRGASSSGKSFIGERVSLLFPPEVVLHATALTTNALYYFTPGTLRHRWVVAGERSRITDDDQAEATRALREMIESGRLSKAVPIKEQNQIVTRLIEQDGPIAYCESTTLNNVFTEDANRCLLLTTDETEDQTKRILDATATAAAGENGADHERIRAVHHAMQRMIPRVDVVIPFANAIAAHYPTSRLESRRDFRHLLQLVRACALLHFRQREQDGSGAVVATLHDYAVGERLARAPLGAAASGVTEGARLYLAQLRTKFGDGVFTTTEAKKIEGASERTQEGRLHSLNNVGAVEQTDAGKGRVPAKWKLTGMDPASGEGILPTVEQVRETYSHCEHANNAQPL